MQPVADRDACYDPEPDTDLQRVLALVVRLWDLNRQHFGARKEAAAGLGVAEKSEMSRGFARQCAETPEFRELESGYSRLFSRLCAVDLTQAEVDFIKDMVAIQRVARRNRLNKVDTRMHVQQLLLDRFGTPVE